jgi:hypothetical protein
MIMPLDHDQRVSILVFGSHEPGCLFLARQSADIEPVALTNRVIGQA